jgi:hypothetical protein
MDKEKEKGISRILTAEGVGLPSAASIAAYASTS